MEKAEFQSPQLINVEVSIYPFFLNMETETSSGSHAKAETKRRKPYHKTIAAVFLASLLEVRDNERPNPDDVAKNIHQPKQRKVTCLNRPLQRVSRLHPIPMLSAFELSHDEFSHRKRIERPEHSGSSFLQAAFEQPDVKSWIVQHSAHAPASQRLFVAFYKSVWPPRNQHQRRPTANRTQNLPKENQFAASIAMIAINHPHSHTVKTVPPPRPHEHPSAGTTFLKLTPKLLVQLHPLDDPIQNPWKHSI